MKKIFIFLALVVIIVALVGYKFISYKNEQNQIQKENLEFDKYKDQEVNGIDVASLINKAIDRNTKNKVEKDDQGTGCGKRQRTVETGWFGRKGRILSESAFRRSEAANCDCKSTGNESGNHAV